MPMTTISTYNMNIKRTRGAFAGAFVPRRAAFIGGADRGQCFMAM